MQDVRVMGRSTQGVRLVHVKEGDTLVAMEKLSLNEDETLTNIEEESASPQV